MICTTFKQSTSSTNIKTSKECMNGFFTSKLAGSEFNVSLSCLLCNEVIKQNILCERTNLFCHIGHAYVEQFLDKHMSTSFENSKACKNMKLLAPTLRILHDNDYMSFYLSNDNSQEENNKIYDNIQKGYENLISLTNTIFLLTPYICEKWLYKRGLHKLSIEAPSIMHEHDNNKSYQIQLRNTESHESHIKRREQAGINQ